MLLKQAKFFSWLIAILCIISTLIINLFTDSDYYFYFYPSLIKEGELWRLISPSFIHFSLDNFGNTIVNLSFSLMLWFYFGIAVENFEPFWKLPLIFFITSLASSITNYLAYGEEFGGLAGVVFGLVGYCFVFNYFSNLYKKHCPQQMLWFYIIFIFVGFTGIFGETANMGHLAAFVSGAILGFLSSFWREE